MRDTRLYEKRVSVVADASGNATAEVYPTDLPVLNISYIKTNGNSAGAPTFQMYVGVPTPGGAMLGTSSPNDDVSSEPFAPLRCSSEGLHLVWAGCSVGAEMNALLRGVASKVPVNTSGV